MTTPPPTNAASFPALIHAIAVARYEDNLHAMASALDLAYMTLWRWEHGEIRSYNRDGIAKFCAFFGLDQEDVWALIDRDRKLREAGTRPAAYREARPRGPKPMASRRQRRPQPIRGGGALLAEIPPRIEVDADSAGTVRRRRGTPPVGRRRLAMRHNADGMFLIGSRASD